MNDFPITEFLTALRNIMKLQNRQYRAIGLGYGLTAADVSILVFLSNNPIKDSASDIVELKGLSKGNVSTSLDSLEEKGFIRVIPDQNDKRRKHIVLLDRSEPVIEEALLFFRSFSDIFQLDDEAFRKASMDIIKAGKKAECLLGDIK